MEGGQRISESERERRKKNKIRSSSFRVDGSTSPDLLKLEENPKGIKVGDYLRFMRQKSSIKY